MTGIMAGTALAGAAGWIADRNGWASAFLIFGVAGIAYSGLLVAALSDSPPGAASEAPGAEKPPRARFGAALISLFSCGSFLLALGFWGLRGIAGWAMRGWMPTYLQEHFHLSQGESGFTANGYPVLVALVGVLIGGAWADRWSRTNPRARIFVPAIGLGAAVPSFLLASHSSIYAFTALNLVCWGFGSSFAAANMMPILCLIADPRYRATGYGVLNAASAAIGGLAIYGGGALRDSKVDLGPYLTLAGASVAVCAVLILLVRPARGQPAPAA